jgi:hypothetical protein
MARSTGLTPRRGYMIDAATVLVGAVAAGARGRAAATRTGAALILNTSSPAAYATIAVITCAPGVQEIPISGVQARALAAAAASITSGDVRVAAIRATAGTEANAPAGVNTISLQVAD